MDSEKKGIAPTQIPPKMNGSTPNLLPSPKNQEPISGRSYLFLT